MQIGSKACFFSEHRGYKPCLPKFIDMTTVRLYTYSPPEIRVIRGPHQHETVQVDNEMLMLLSRNKKSEILNLHRRLELSMVERKQKSLMPAWQCHQPMQACRSCWARATRRLEAGPHQQWQQHPLAAPQAAAACPREGPAGHSRASKWDQFFSWPHFNSLHRLEFTYTFLYLTAPINWHVEKTKPYFLVPPLP